MRYMVPIIILLVFTAIVTASGIYLSRKIVWIFTWENIKVLYILFAVAVVFSIGGLVGLSNTLSQAWSLVYALAAILLGLLLYLLLSFLFTELLHLIFKFKPAVFGALALSITIIAVTYGLWNATLTRLSEVSLPVKGLKDEVRLMHWTDIHLGHFRGKAFLQKLVEMTNAQEVEFLVITGDLFDGRIELKEETLHPLQNLNVPVYFVEGNHDGYSGLRKIKDLLRQLGVRVLENEVANFRNLQIIGLNHMMADSTSHSMHAAQEGQTIKEVLADLDMDTGKPSILLHHSPDGIQYAAEKGIDVYLAGHTHAGQFFPVNFINDFLFKYNKGIAEFKGTIIFVSQGVGTFGPPMRIATKSEIVLITLGSAK